MSKSSTDTKSSQQQSQSASQSATPGNLAQLQNAWAQNTGLFNSTSGNNQNTDLVNQGLSRVGAGGDAASNAAMGGLQTATQLANGGTANDANQYLTPFANGSMNGANPYFAQMIDQLSKALQPQADGAYGAAGRYGSGANAHAFADSLTREAGTLGYQNYGDALNRQLQAGGQLSTNNTNSTGQAINALGQIAPLASTAVGSGVAQIGAGQQPLDNYAKIIALLGGGGGTGTSSGNAQGSGTSSSTTSGFDLGSAASLLALL